MMRKLVVVFLPIFTAIFVQCTVVPQVSAVSAAGFDPGRIIDDAIFYDPGGMGSVAEVQAFLNAHVPSCDTQGTRPSGYGNLTNAQYAQQIKGWPGPPYSCLNNYYENPTTGETSYEKGGGAFDGGRSAAQIIYDAAQQYKINPKVLLVMLRKESLNLFSDSWPLKSQYKYAMGYACPDSGPNYSANCQSNKAGFFNQINYSAWQLRYYYDNMGTYNFAPGRWNTIQYNPDPACGTKNVYIQNVATASLYIYTPYTPNDAALNAYPGQASCGAYGNRNFWFFWQEWFGSTVLNGNFLRSVSDATVYLVGDRVKYPIADGSLIGAASGLGGVGFVSQTYLDSITTGPLLGRTIQSPDGSVYFYDSNIKLPFTSCAMVTAYGSSCGAAAELTQSQIDKFITGPAVTNGMKTTSGKTFYISSGTKREVFDNQSLVNAGIIVGYNILTDSAFNYLPYGSPYTRAGTIIKTRQDASRQYLQAGASTHKILTSQFSDKTFSTLPTGLLDDQSVNKLTIAPNAIDDSISSDLGKLYVLTSDGKKEVQNPASFAIASVQLPNNIVTQLAGTGSLSNPALIKTTDDATVYVVVNGQKRPLVAMEDLKSITGEDTPYIGWVAGKLISTMPTGNIIIGAGRLVMTPINATVYMTDGYDKLVPMSSFVPASDAGLNMSIRVITNDILSKYTVDNTVLSSYVSCGGVNYLAMSGILYQLTISGQVARTLQPQTCNVLKKVTALPRFLQSSDSTIYEFRSGTAYPIGSWSAYQTLSANGGSSVQVPWQTVNLLPKGAVIR